MSVWRIQRPADLPYAFAEAWNDGDADALAALFAQECDFVNVVGLWWEDRGSVRDAHEYGFRKIFAGSRMELERVKTRSLGDGVAIVVVSWTLTGQSPSAGQSPDGQQEPGARHGVFTFVLVSAQQGWLAVAAQNTDRVPGSETQINLGGQLRPETYQDRLGQARQ